MPGGHADVHDGDGEGHALVHGGLGELGGGVTLRGKGCLKVGPELFILAGGVKHGRLQVVQHVRVIVGWAEDAPVVLPDGGVVIDDQDAVVGGVHRMSAEC